MYANEAYMLTREIVNAVVRLGSAVIQVPCWT